MAVLFAVGALAACGDDDDDDTVAPATDGTVAIQPAISSIPPTGSTAVPIPSETASAQVTVTATDYRFDGLPSSTVTGTAFKLQNDSEKEVHEMIFIRIPDEVTETVGQILALPEEEQMALVGDEPPALVLVALPGEEGMVVEGSGTLDEPGRYAVLCFIPVGADPQVVADAMASEATGPPDMGDGPPHVMEGMYGEVVVE